MRFGAVVVAGLMFASMAAAQQVKAPQVTVQQVTVQQVTAPDPQIPTKLQNKAAIPDQRQKTLIILHNLTAALNASGCPGALRARQQATGGATIWTTALEDRNAWTPIPQGLGIHIDFQGTKTAVKALELRVDYLPLGLHRMEVAPGLANTSVAQPQERTKTFDLDRESAMRIDADLLVGPAATITRVHLVSATFANGAVWHASSDDACTVVPSRLMLVAAR